MTKEICGNCTHWKPTVREYGICGRLGESLEIEVIAGWDGGYVNVIESERGFGCVLFAEREVVE